MVEVCHIPFICAVPGKLSNWMIAGSGVFGWGTEEEEDTWDVDLDFVCLESEDCPHEEHHANAGMTIGELMEWRYFRAEHEKEQVLSAR